MCIRDRNNFSISSETFNLEEGEGSTTTGSEGTIGTIYTSHANGGVYIDEEVWGVSSTKWIEYKQV